MADNRKVSDMTFPIEWHIPEGLVARYATNMVVQRSENEFYISFFEIKPPLFLGTPEEISQQASQLNAVRATCIAQVIVAADNMPSFIETLQTTFQKLKSDKTTEEV